VAILPSPQLVAGRLSPADLDAVGRWIRLNEAALIEHCNGEIDGGDLIERLRPLSHDRPGFQVEVDRGASPPCR
jgi:hypothetical protein